MIMLVIPEVGSLNQVLASTLQLCGEMKGAQAACESVHDQLREIYGQVANAEENVLSKASLDKLVAVVDKFRKFLDRNRQKKLVYRVIEHRQMVAELHNLNEDVDTLYGLFNVSAARDWKRAWDVELRVQEATFAAAATSKTTVKKELQDQRSRVEALMTLKFEVEKRAARRDVKMTEIMNSMLQLIVSELNTTEQDLPPWFIPSYEVDYEPQPFARGNSATLHCAVWGLGTRVVVKRFDDTVIDRRAQVKVEKEINIWHQLNHPNVVRMFGASHISSPPFIVCEDAVNGDLGSFLVENDNKKQMWQLLHQAALGLDYIHSKGVVHGDLKLNNILVGSDGQAKVADFGLSIMRVCSTLSSPSLTSPIHGGLRWRAPECLTKKATARSDVYSFAMCIIEAVIDEPPLSFQDDDMVRANLGNGVLPDRPSEMSGEVWGLVKSMMSIDPSKRILSVV